MKIDAEEQAKRLDAINFARGSVRYEGFILDEKAEKLFARYVNGELTRPQLNAELKENPVQGNFDADI